MGMCCLKCGGKLEHRHGDSTEGTKEESYKCRVCGTGHTRRVDYPDHRYLIASNGLYVEY